MKKIISLVIVFICFGLMTSCVSLALKAVGADAKEVKSKFLSSEDKEIVFIGMHHIGKKEFYDGVHYLTDSLGKKGYVSFYEKVKVDDTTNLKKMRKVLGFHIPQEGYLDTVNNMLLGQFKVSDTYMNQPKPERLISVNSKSYKADVNLTELINAFESERGEIILDSCDLATPLKNSFKCDSYRKTRKEDFKVFKKDFALNYRDKYLAKRIDTSSYNKIVVIYGRAHYDGLYTELKKLNNNWKEN